MNIARVSTAIPIALAIGGLAMLTWWRNLEPLELQARVPGLDRPAGEVTVAKSPVSGKLTKFEGKAAEILGEWPGFRGPRLDGICHDAPALATKWPSGGPSVLWSVDLGEGYAGAAVRAGRVYVLDYDRQASADALRCFSLADGKEIWRFSYPMVIKRNHGMSRTVPAVTDKFIVTLGPKCQVACLDPISGEMKWMLDLVGKFHTTVPQWYAGQCPLIEGDRVILAPGGDALMVAVDCATGNVLWKSPNPRGWAMTHVSIVPMEFAGKRMYVYCGKGGVAGVSADDGRILWDTTDWKISIATVPTPVVLPGGRIFFCGGYNAGGRILQLETKGDQLLAKTVAVLKATQFGATQHTPILYDNHLFGLREKDKQLVCMELDGRVVWSSGSAHKFGLGPFLIADQKIFIVDDGGKMTLAEATSKGYRQLDEAQVLAGPDAWAPMAMVGGRLLVRDLNRMTCLDVSKK
jgi:outer membrane protein assembly factor BamB